MIAITLEPLTSDDAMSLEAFSDFDVEPNLLSVDLGPRFGSVVQTIERSLRDEGRRVAGLR